MYLTYDDVNRNFQFDVEQPLEDNLHFPEVIEVTINLDGGQDAFPRAYSIAKYFEQQIPKLSEHCDTYLPLVSIEGIHQRLVNISREAEEFIRDAQMEFDAGNMPEEMFAVIIEGSEATIESCDFYLSADRETLFGDMRMVELTIDETNVVAHMGLPDIVETLASIPFSYALPPLEDEAQRAMFERQREGHSLH